MRGSHEVWPSYEKKDWFFWHLKIFIFKILFSHYIKLKAFKAYLGGLLIEFVSLSLKGGNKILVMTVVLFLFYLLIKSHLCLSV